jgi:hypothetical protein
VRASADPPKPWWQSSPDAAGVHQVAAFEVSDQDRIEHLAIRNVTADYELADLARAA